VNFNINVSAGTGTPSGDVSLIAQAGAGPNNTTAIGPFTLSSGGVAGSTSMLPGGSYTVSAHYAGNGTFGSSDSTPGIPVTVSKESSQTQVHLVTFDPGNQIVSNNATSVPYGSLYLLRMDVTNSSGNLCANQVTELFSYACPSGKLTVTPAPTDQNAPAGTVSGQYTLNSQGYAEDQPIQQPPGVYNFVAQYGGDNSYNASTSPTLPITITQAPTVTTVTATPSSTVAQTTVEFTANISTQSYGASMGGTVQFFKNGTPWISAGTGGTPTPGQYVTSHVGMSGSFPVGTTTISAQYSGDSNYVGSTSAPVTITVTDFSFSANPSTINIAAPGQGGSSTVTVTPISGFAGTVNFSAGNGCPTGATCTFSPASVNVTSASPVTSTLTITTTGSAASPPLVIRRTPPSFRLPFRLLALLAGTLVLAFLVGNWAKRWRPAISLPASLVLIAGVWLACGGGGNVTPPPPPAPVLRLSPSALTFKPQIVGTTSPAQTVTLTNVGNSGLDLMGSGMAGTNSGDFAETNNCGGSVSVSASCAFTVTFSPTATGARSANVLLIDDASGSPQSIPVSGTGNPPPTPAGTYYVLLNAASGSDLHFVTVNVVVQ
jgi:hypothetical protein